MQSAYLKIINGSFRSPCVWLALPLLWALSIPYRLVVAWKNRRFDQGRMTTRVGVPVVSIGNLTTGGTGKTPMVRYVARWLRDCGVRVTLLSRGYKAEQGNLNDEALELERRLPDVPHLQNASRVESAGVAIEEFAAQVLLLDDGFQHRYLERDLDIVLIDATCPFGYGRLLPAGLLREPLSSLRRAGLVIITRVDQVHSSEVDQIRQTIKKHNATVPIVEFTHHIEGFENYSGEVLDASALATTRVIAFSGIGNPTAFETLLKAQGVDVADHLKFEDHHHFDREDVRQITARADELSADSIVCTMKDLVKIQVDRLGDKPLWALSVGMEPFSGEEMLVQQLGRVVNLVELDE